MPNHEKILSHLPKMLVDHESWKAPYKVKIRPSSFPFCQIEWLFAELDPIDASVGDSFMETIFLKIGIATHEVAQTYLGRAGILYGMWKCKKCFHESSPILGTPHCNDNRCTWTRGKDQEGNLIGPEKPCGEGYATRYVEFEMVDLTTKWKCPECRGKETKDCQRCEGTGEVYLKAHCDGLIMLAGRLYLLEIKTKASSSVVRRLKKPDPPHIAQASTYAELATPREWGLDQDIEGIAFCYVPRDYPNKMRVMFHPKDPTTLSNFRRDLPAVTQILRNGKIEEARAICPNERFARKVRYCEYAAQCFRPDRTEYLKKKRKALIKVKKAERAARASEKSE